MDDTTARTETPEDKALGDKLLEYVNSKTDEEWAKVDVASLYGFTAQEAQEKPTHAGRHVTVGAFRAMEKSQKGEGTTEDMDKAGFYMHGISLLVKGAFDYVASGFKQS